MDAVDLVNRFSYHSLDAHQVARCDLLRVLGLDLARMIVASGQPCREQSIAITRLEEVIMWASAAIARSEVPVPEDN